MPLFPMNRLNVLSIPVNTGAYAEFVEQIVLAATTKQSEYACVANVHMLIEAYKNKRFAHVVKNAGYVTPDGKPLTWAIRLLHGVKQERVAGMDLLPDLLRAAEANNLSVFFYGGTSDLLRKTDDYLKENFTYLKTAGFYSPPFRPLTILEERKVAEKINASGASFVFVILGCPRQEKWMAGMKNRIHAMMVGVGGALPVMIGAQKRAPKWMQKVVSNGYIV